MVEAAGRVAAAVLAATGGFGELAPKTPFETKWAERGRLDPTTYPNTDPCCKKIKSKIKEALQSIERGATVFVGVSLDAYFGLGVSGSFGLAMDQNGIHFYVRSAAGTGEDMSFGAEFGYSNNFWGWAYELQGGVGPLAMGTAAALGPGGGRTTSGFIGLATPVQVRSGVSYTGQYGTLVPW